MKTVGIIAEYNPFHNGHQYLITEARRQSGADYVIAAMGGDFLQRGVPAVTDKYTRAYLALLGGADLVLELPVVWATASAEYFAAGAVRLLAETGTVDTLAFGLETAGSDLLSMLADVLLREQPRCQEQIDRALKSGAPYPLARSRALCALLPERPSEEISDFLSQPNNILALEYEKALLHRARLGVRTMETLPVARIGAYHGTDAEGGFAGAEAIRALLAEGGDTLPERLSALMPNAALLLAERDAGRLLSPDDFSSALYMRLLTLQEQGYAEFADCGCGGSKRILRQLEHYTGFTSFAARLKSKNVTYTRICRSLLHILLDVRQSDYASLQDPHGVPYFRVLGFRKSAAPLLSALQEKASAPVLLHAADARRLLSGTAMRQLSHDIAAADLYRTVAAIKCGQEQKNEYRQPPVMV